RRSASGGSPARAKRSRSPDSSASASVPPPDRFHANAAAGELLKLAPVGALERYRLPAAPTGQTCLPLPAGEQLDGVAPERFGESLWRVAVQVARIAFVGERGQELCLLRTHHVAVRVVEQHRPGSRNAGLSFDSCDGRKSGRLGVERRTHRAGGAGFEGAGERVLPGAA